MVKVVGINMLLEVSKDLSAPEADEGFDEWWPVEADLSWDEEGTRKAFIAGFKFGQRLMTPGERTNDNS